MAATKTSEFKQTEIGEIPADWDLKPLHELFEVQQGKALSKKARSGISSRPFLRTANVLWGRLDLNIVDKMDFNEGQIEKLDLKIGDLMTCEGGAVGRTAIWRGEIPGCSFQNHIHRLRVKNKEVIVPAYAMYWLQAAFLLLKLYAGIENRTTIPNLSKTRLEQLLFLLPPKPEQERIAGVLSKIQQAVENQEKIVADLRELKAATIAKLFREGLRGERLKQTEIGEIPQSWMVSPLGSVCAETKTMNPAKNPDKMIEYVDVSSVSREECRIVSSTKYLGKDAPGRARNLVNHRDVVFATVRPTLRRVAIIPRELDGQLVSTAFCVIRALAPRTYPEYIYYVVSSADFVARVGRMERGANYPAVTDGNVLAQMIALPKYEEQKEIANAMSGIDENLNMVVRKHAQLKSLFSSTLNQLMTGKVRITDWNRLANPKTLFVVL